MNLNIQIHKGITSPVFFMGVKLFPLSLGSKAVRVCLRKLFLLEE